MFTKTLALAALAAAPALATPAVNVYWGQRGTESDRLRTFCDTPGFDYVTVGFVNSSPEHDPSGLKYPGTDFARHCMNAYYQDAQHRDSKLLSKCGRIAADVRYCQKKGKKVLLSIGGHVSSTAEYSISSPPEGEYFADFIWGAFGPYSPSWTKARPFDDFYGGADEGEEHFVFDGFDFDIEEKFEDQSGYVAMVRRLRALTQMDSSKNYLITAAPECHLGDRWFKMKTIIQECAFDALFIQFYNNNACEGRNNNFDQWVAHLAGTASKDAKIFIGLPGSPDAAGSGYLGPLEARNVLLAHMKKPSFGGVMVWDAYLGSHRPQGAGGKRYYEWLHSLIGATPSPTTPSTPAPTACVKEHVIVPGDTCYELANYYGLDLAELIRYNLGVNCTALREDQRLCVKLGHLPSTTTTAVTTTSTSTSATSTSTTSSSTSEVFTSTSAPEITSTTTSDVATSTSTKKDETSASASETTSTTTSDVATSTSAPETASTTTSDAATSTSTKKDETSTSTKKEETSTSTKKEETSTSTKKEETSTSTMKEATSTSTMKEATSTSTKKAETSTSTKKEETSTSAPETTSTSSDAATSTSTKKDETSTVSDVATSTSTKKEGTSTSAPETTSTSSDAATSTSTKKDETSASLSSSSTTESPTITSAPETTSTATSDHLYAAIEHVEGSTITSAPETTATATSDVVISTSIEDDDTCEDDETSTSLSSSSTSSIHAGETTSASASGSVSSTSDSGANPTSTSSQSYTTSTIYTTTTYTVTSCGPAATSCGSHVVTSTIAVSTTVCPVTETATSAPEPETSDGGSSWTTSTIYSTKTYTITSCAPTATADCPGKIGHVTTEIVAIGTTVCPVTDEATPTVTPVPSSGSNAGEEYDSTSTTTLTTVKFTTLTVPKPDAPSTAASHTPSGGFVPSSGSGVVTPSSSPSVPVTAGAGRNAVAALGVPVVLAAAILALAL
ncbi:Endochitinase 2 [Madurella mycetomatis]|uniref:chitinase n=1 Tax=Madurella mycetomatis TaxID=100816 RepID=A0A175WGB1_9PEZI|nr:Endochitinase 2 [Madurella mycetomatis]